MISAIFESGVSQVLKLNRFYHLRLMLKYLLSALLSGWYPLDLGPLFHHRHRCQPWHRCRFGMVQWHLEPTSENLLVYLYACVSFFSWSLLLVLILILRAHWSTIWCLWLALRPLWLALTSCCWPSDQGLAKKNEIPFFFQKPGLSDGFFQDLLLFFSKYHHVLLTFSHFYILWK